MADRREMLEAALEEVLEPVEDEGKPSSCGDSTSAIAASNISLRSAMSAP